MLDTSIFAKSSDIKERKPEKVYGEVYNGRYFLPDADDPASWIPGSFEAKPMPRGYMRTSNLIGAYSETRALDLWQQRKILRGIRERPDIYADLMTLDLDEEGDLLGYQRIIDLALRQARADEASVIGTAYHKVLEHHLKTGQWIGTPKMIEGIGALLDLLKSHLLRPEPSLAERIVVNTEVKCAGRFDVPVWDMPTGRLLMADLKTKQKQFWTVLEQRAQLAVYARAHAMWDPNRQCYVRMPEFDPLEGIILHVPQGGGKIELLTMDLERGWRTAQRAREVVDDRAGAKSIPMLRSIVREPVALVTLEQWAIRLSLVTSLQEGSEILRQAKEALPGREHELDELAGRIAKDLVRQQLTS